MYLVLFYDSENDNRPLSVFFTDDPLQAFYTAEQIKKELPESDKVEYKVLEVDKDHSSKIKMPTACFTFNGELKMPEVVRKNIVGLIDEDEETEEDGDSLWN